MDKFIISFLLLDESAHIAIAFLLIIAGGFLAAMLLDVKIAMRRVGYLWFVALLGLALSISQALWVLTPAAAETGLLSLLAIATMGCFLLFGGGYYYGSAARSNHIGGDTSRAWLGFVPFANLWLMGKSGAAQTSAPKRHLLARFILDPVLVLGAITVFMVTQVFDKALQNEQLFSAGNSQALSTMINEAQTLEQSFAAEAKASGAMLPIRVDDITVMSKIEAIGRTLRIIYDVEQPIDGFPSEFEATLAELQCGPKMFASDIARGGTVELVYRGTDGGVLGTFKITQEDCSA